MNTILETHTFPSGQTFKLVQGDLTKEEVDAIVNAANDHLAHGGGVAGVISRAGGKIIQKESNDWVAKYGPIPHDSPAYTSAGKLPARYVIHAVGPVWLNGRDDEDNKLAAAVIGSLRLANKLKLTSIAFPAISTGIFGFPKEQAARIILQTVNDYFAGAPDSGLEDVHMTVYNQSTTDIFRQVWQEMHSR